MNVWGGDRLILQRGWWTSEVVSVWGGERLGWWTSGVGNVWGGEHLRWWTSGVVNIWFYTGGGERLRWWTSGVVNVWVVNVLQSDVLQHCYRIWPFQTFISIEQIAQCFPTCFRFCICFTLELVCLLGPIWFKGNPNAIQLICVKPDKQECPSRSCLVHKTPKNPLPYNGAIKHHLAGLIPQSYILVNTPKVFHLLWIF